MIASRVVNVPINSESSRLIKPNAPTYFRTTESRSISVLNGSRLPFASDPPEHRSHPNQDNQGEQYDQRGLLDPGDRRHEKCHDDPEYAHLPRLNVHAGNEGAESQQKKNSKTGCISIHHVLHAG